MEQTVPSYGVGNIRQLKGLEAVRERVSMYLGDPTNGDALHHCIWEVVDNSVDEHLAGHCTHITVRLLKNRMVAVHDNGRGIPVGMHPDGINTLEMVMTSLHAGGKFDNDAYEKSAGLHGIGVAAVNGISEYCHAEVSTGGSTWMQGYSQGKPTNDVHEIGASEETGTEIVWRWDPLVLSGHTDYDRVRISNKLREVAFLNPGLCIELEDLRGKAPKVERFHYKGGIQEYLEEIASKKKHTTDPLYFIDGPAGSWNVEMAMVWTSGVSEDVRCYANNTRNSDGGTHLTGFKNGLTRMVTAYAKEHGMLRGLSSGLVGSDIRDGLVAIVNVRLREVAFSSQTKDKLVTPYAKTCLEDLFRDQVTSYLQSNPKQARNIAERAVLSARAREAARKAREQVKRKDFLDLSSLPGKLSDCQSKDPRDSEIFIVEGDSAGGSSKGARDRRYQAILPLRGKVLNVERADIDSILDNKEIGTLATALGCGLENTSTFNMKKLRYHKIVIMTDADVDGAHIRTLLLTFFYRCLPQLIYSGHVYIALPPLYSVRIKGRKVYFNTEEQYREFLKERSPEAAKKLHTTRYKGLGEMNAEDLWKTTLNPENRVLRPVGIRDAVQAEDTFYRLMGTNVEIRREWIEDNAIYADLDV